MLKITNNKGRPFRVCVILKGEHYGLNDCLTHDHADPLVEFYDADQFVTRYYLSTLTARPSPVGLCLCGHVSEWEVSAANVAAAVNYAVERLTGRAA